MQTDNIPEIHCYSCHPTRISNKTVARKVKKILQVIAPEDINHVHSEENPADPASRGLEPQKFVECSQWQFLVKRKDIADNNLDSRRDGYLQPYNDKRRFKRVQFIR
jgi:hypothetical protein